jgi:hypothetical protein
VEFTLRTTNGYRKVNREWKIAHEHFSVPVDLGASKADMMSKP